MIEFDATGIKHVTLEEIASKPTWYSEDIELLIANQDYLDDKTLIRLGLKEEVKKK